MLSADKAREYVANSLKVPELASRLEGSDGRQHLQLLNEMCRAFVNKVPFQNLDLMALPVSERDIPSEDECVAACLSGRGGICWTLNSFFYLLLEALGFKVFPVLCSVRFPDARDHLAILVKDLLEKDDTHIVDVGFGCPYYQAVSLDFESVSPEFYNSFNTDRMMKTECGDFVRVQKTTQEDTPTGQYPKVANGWRYAYYFENKPMSLKAISDVLRRQVYVRPDGPFNKNIFFIVFNRDVAFSVRHGRKVGESEVERGQYVMTDVTYDQTLVEKMAKLAPQIPRDVIERAVEYWRQCAENSGKPTSP